jgi:hypothetical protein
LQTGGAASWSRIILKGKLPQALKGMLYDKKKKKFG